MAKLIATVEVLRVVTVPSSDCVLLRKQLFLLWTSLKVVALSDQSSFE